MSTSTQLAGAEPGLIDLDRVAELLRERGVAAQVEQTGGGTATLYADPTGDPLAGDARHAVAVGPGFFAGPGFTFARAYREELVIGPDDDGEVTPLDTPARASEADVAAIVQTLIALGDTAYPVVPLAGGQAARRALAALRLRVWDDREPGDRTDYAVLDLHGVSIGVKRRARDLYVHVDTSETPDQVVAVEINGGGEHDHPVG